MDIINNKIKKETREESTKIKISCIMSNIIQSILIRLWYGNYYSTRIQIYKGIIYSDIYLTIQFILFYYTK